ncbi:MAG: hypothetical protein OEY52_14390 [Gammaproteobacteria bacterium]|nr:hypothetical protein [Gammaproteobacteria bacterium]
MNQHLVKVFILLFILSGCQESVNYAKSDRYPWQVTLMSDGSSQIFGIHLGVTTVDEVWQMLGKGPKLALFENPDGKLSLELFYKEFTRAGLSGKLILTVENEGNVLQDLKQQAHKKEQLESGVTQHYMQTQSLPVIESLKIVAMTYMPYADLEEEMVTARFGEPAEKIRSHEKAQHWLYPDKGLDLIINESGKEILQYVSPKEFTSLVKPLRP